MVSKKNPQKGKENQQSHFIRDQHRQRLRRIGLAVVGQTVPWTQMSTGPMLQATSFASASCGPFLRSTGLPLVLARDYPSLIRSSSPSSAVSASDNRLRQTPTLTHYSQYQNNGCRPKTHRSTDGHLRGHQPRPPVVLRCRPRVRAHPQLRRCTVQMP